MEELQAIFTHTTLPFRLVIDDARLFGRVAGWRSEGRHARACRLVAPLLNGVHRPQEDSRPGGLIFVINPLAKPPHINYP